MSGGQEGHEPPCAVLHVLGFTQTASSAHVRAPEKQMQTFQILFSLWLPPHCGVMEEGQMGRLQRRVIDGL